jgi:hypothetical protein
MRYGHIIMPVICAWVLWQQADTFHENGSVTSSFEMIGAEEARPACLVWAERAAQYLGKAVKGKVENATVTADGSPYMFLFKCLPDTADPRAPKGK